MYTQHVILREFNKNIIAFEKAKTICNVYGQGVITDRQIRNWFSKFHSPDKTLTDEPRPGLLSFVGEDALRERVERNPLKSTRDLAFELNTSLSTI